MSQALIAIPTRDQLEELFPTTARVPLDAIAQNALRTIVAFQNMVRHITRPLYDLDNNGTPVDPENRNAPCHYLAISADYFREVDAGNLPKRSLNSPEATHWVASRFAAATPEQIEYCWRSMESTLASQYFAGSHLMTAASLDALLDRPCVLAFTATMNAYVGRRYPHVRFRAVSFLRYVLHPDELDASGVPRVSLDGYNLEPSLIKL